MDKAALAMLPHALAALRAAAMVWAILLRQRRDLASLADERHAHAVHALLAALLQKACASQSAGESPSAWRRFMQRHCVKTQTPSL